MDPRMAERRRTVAETRVRAGLRRLLILMVVAGIGATGLVVLRSAAFSLDEIEVEGRVETDPVAAAASAGAVAGTPLIDLDLGAISAAVESDPRVVSADVGRRWPTGLSISVVERFPVAWVDQGGGWAHTAVDGVVIATGDPGPVAPRIRSAPGGDRAVEAALRFIDALPDQLAAGMVIDARTEELMGTWNGFIIRIGRPTDVVAKARALEVVLATEPPPGSQITVIAPDRPAVLPPDAVSDDSDSDSDSQWLTPQTVGRGTHWVCWRTQGTRTHPVWWVAHGCGGLGWGREVSTCSRG